MNKVITRLAPSPTSGFLHLGNIRTMLYNYLYAKKNGGKFLVRLEDTDRNRYNPEFLDYFKRTCDWLGIIPDASYWNPDPSIGSFIQSERNYQDRIDYLIDNGFAYYAFDTKEDIEDAHKKIPNFKYDSTTRMNMRNSLSLSKYDVDTLLDSGTPYVVRFSVTPDLDIEFNDEVLGKISINTNILDDKVLLKSNGIGSYHLCNVCDDHDMGITHVMRGQEWVNSTPLHILIYKAFGWDVPTFVHLPLIMNPDGVGKLSKRSASKHGIPIAPLGYKSDDGVWNDGWKELGYDPKALLNTLALIGWNPGGDVEIMTLKEMIDSFSIDRVHKAGARFDMVKAKWINSQHLKNTPNSCLRPFIKLKDDRYSDDKIDMIISLSKDRVDFRKDLNTIVDLFFDDFVINDFKKIDDNYKSVMKVFIDNIGDINFDNKDDIKDSLYNICMDEGTKLGKIMPGLRMALVNGVSGPDLLTTMQILGKDQVVDRVSKSINKLIEK